MPIERSIDSRNIVSTHLNGLISHEHALAALRDLAELTRHLDEIYEIVINGPEVLMETSSQQQLAYAQQANRIYDRYTRGAIAIVGCTDQIFSLCRQMQTMIRNDKITTSVFFNEADARDWISRIQSP